MGSPLSLQDLPLISQILPLPPHLAQLLQRCNDLYIRAQCILSCAAELKQGGPWIPTVGSGLNYCPGKACLRLQSFCLAA